MLEEILPSKQSYLLAIQSLLEQGMHIQITEIRMTSHLAITSLQLEHDDLKNILRVGLDDLEAGIRREVR